MNTLRAIESLTQTGFSEEQARAVIGVVSEVVDDRTVTGQDFAGLKGEFADLRGEFADLKGEFADLKGEFAGLKGDFAGLRDDFAGLSRQVDSRIATFDLKLDAKMAGLEASIANAKTQMVLYTGAIVAGIATISRLFA